MSELESKIKARLLPDENGCWVWQGAKVRKGYGVVQVPGKGRITYTHRAMYEASKGLIPEGMQIDHLCRNPACCNPNHLEAVTPKENTRRGFSLEAQRRRKLAATHCRHGHAYTEENSYFSSKGDRFCRECKRISHAKWAELRRTKTGAYRNLTALGDNVVSIGGGKNG